MWEWWAELPLAAQDDSLLLPHHYSDAAWVSGWAHTSGTLVNHLQRLLRMKPLVHCSCQQSKEFRNWPDPWSSILSISKQDPWEKVNFLALKLLGFVAGWERSVPVSLGTGTPLFCTSAISERQYINLCLLRSCFWTGPSKDAFPV